MPFKVDFKLVYHAGINGGDKIYPRIQIIIRALNDVFVFEYLQNRPFFVENFSFSPA
jgi:hypothetical protein